MTISHAAARAGLTPSAIRYYERMGVLPAPDRRGRERRFTESDIDALVWIRRARAAGVALVDVEATVDLPGGVRERGATLVRRLLALDARRTELRDALSAVESLYGETRAVLATLARSIPDGFIGHD
jgi:DNA-binding transcriptional MerR regulator